ncbi:MAG: ribonuclease H-like domain-containing protein [Thermodesulfobacteriota bacterium]
MLFNTFLHIPGIGAKTEKKIWLAGIQSWDQWRPPFSSTLSGKIINLVTIHLQKFAAESNGTAAYYASLLPAGQLWRLFPHFRKQTAYLDIETEGDRGTITTIALADGQRLHTYVQGENLADFLTDIATYEVIVTYNGTGFDLPVIESFFSTRLNQVHIDLRSILARLGYKGGLKACEKNAGIARPGLEGLDGFAAVLLWRRYQQAGDKAALATLLAYNCADAANLEHLLVHAYNRNIANTPFRQTNYIPTPPPPRIPFTPDQRTIARIRDACLHC